MRLIGSYARYKFKLLREDWITRRYFYHHAPFAACDRQLLKAYRFINPYRLSKQFLEGRGEDDPHQYGETPIRTYWKIAEACGLTVHDTVIELGCGRGRGLFFLATYYGCRVHGIEWNPHFVALAKTIPHPKVSITCGDMLTAPLAAATVIYLYGTCLKEESLAQLTHSFKQLAKGTKIVTVSAPLECPDYLHCTREIPVLFPWGKTLAYLHERGP